MEGILELVDGFLNTGGRTPATDLLVVGPLVVDGRVGDWRAAAKVLTTSFEAVLKSACKLSPQTCHNF